MSIIEIIWLLCVVPAFILCVIDHWVLEWGTSLGLQHVKAEPLQWWHVIVFSFLSITLAPVVLTLGILAFIIWGLYGLLGNSRLKNANREPTFLGRPVFKQKDSDHG